MLQQTLSGALLRHTRTWGVRGTSRTLYDRAVRQGRRSSSEFPATRPGSVLWTLDGGHDWSVSRRKSSGSFSQTGTLQHGHETRDAGFVERAYRYGANG